MRGARLVVLGVAVAAGGVAAYLASGNHKPAPEAPKAPVVQLETVEVLVAKTDLDRGQVLAAGSIGWQVWPKAAANANFITKTARPDAIAQFNGSIVRVPVAAGQPIYDPFVVFAKGSGFLAATLPQGMRAVAVSISPESGAGGFILPEDHVDILLTRHDKVAEKASGTETIVTDTILRNVPVLAVDQTVEDKNGQKVALAKTATLELTPQQAEAIEAAHQMGTLSLSLRGLVDSQSPNPEGSGADADKAAMHTVSFGVRSLTMVAR
jgi:pilus assembly protein CpaB